MEQDNLEFLQRNTLFYKGYGNDLYGALEQNMKKPDVKNFILGKSIAFDTLNNNGYDYKLEYRRTSKKGSERFFQNSTIATSKDDPSKTFSFYVTPSDGIPAKVAASFLEGKPIYRKGKDEAGIAYENWHQFKKNEEGKYEEKIYYKSHGFDPMDALKELPYGKDVKPEALQGYERSVRRGDDLNMMLEFDGKKDRYSVQANLDGRTLDIYDKQGKLVLQQPALSEDARKKMEKEQAQEQPAPKMKAATAKAEHRNSAQKTKRIPPRKTQPVQGASQSKAKRK